MFFAYFDESDKNLQGRSRLSSAPAPLCACSPVSAGLRRRYPDARARSVREPPDS